MIVATSYVGAVVVVGASRVLVIAMLQRSSRVSKHVRRRVAASQAGSRLSTLTARKRDSLSRCDGCPEARITRRRPREWLHPHAAPPSWRGRVLRVVHDPVLRRIRRGDEARVTDAEHPRVAREHRTALHPKPGVEGIGSRVAQAELPDRVL